MVKSEIIMPAKDDIHTMVGRIYDLKEAAEVLKIKPRTLRQWIKDKKIKAFKMGGGGLVRIHEADLQTVIDQAQKRGARKGGD
jgi:excisionase family DNA binding protein